MNEGEAFIRDAAAKRGIDPEIALRVADSEGGRKAPGLVGKFATGWSFWQFQLHYGGVGYEHFGTVAGMGNGFTEFTKWPPGETRAWRDACRYALNRARNGGWTPWYGAAAVGISKWQGINREAMWDSNSELWDFEGAAAPAPPSVPAAGRVTYNKDEPPHIQELSYDCSQESMEWALYALGRKPSDDWLEQAMIAEGVMSAELGCLDASGAGLAGFIRRHYGEFGYDANNQTVVGWNWICNEGAANPNGSGHRYPVLIGGNRWYHWAAVRDFDPGTGQLLLANSAPGYGGVGQTMNRTQWDQLGHWNAVRVWHPDVLGSSGPATPATPPETREQSLYTAVAELTRGNVRKAVGDLRGKSGAELDRQVGNIERELERIAVEFIGPPARRP